MPYDPSGYPPYPYSGRQPQIWQRPPPVVSGPPAASFQTPAPRGYGQVPTPPRPQPPAGRARWPYALLAGAVLVLGGGAWTLYDRNIVFEDSGIKACEAMRDGNTTFNGDPQNERPMTEKQYHELREVFANSRYDDIRDHGTKLMDVVWQMSRAIGDGSEEGDDGAAFGVALVYLQPLTTHATGLQSACADQGIFVDLTRPGG